MPVTVLLGNNVAITTKDLLLLTYTPTTEYPAPA